MKTLSGLDATFLYLETPQTPMHVGSFCLYELPKGFRGSFRDAVRAHIASRMHLAPIFTRRLAFMPLDLGHPIWVESGEVDLDQHIRKVPGGSLTVRQAQSATARLHGRLIDRTRPLWEFHVFDSIQPPPGADAHARIVGLYSKIHHAALDGQAGTVLANAILDLVPSGRKVPPAGSPHDLAQEPTMSEMIGAVFSNSLAQYAKLARALPSAAASVGRTIARESFAGGRAAGGLRSRLPIGLAPRTIFNVGIGADRVFATATLPLSACRQFADAAGCSFNDMVLWLCSTALRRYLSREGSVPRKSLVAAMPVSLRGQRNEDMNNQASLTLVDLGTQHENPVRRMNAIMASTAKVKDALSSLRTVLPTDYPSLLSPWLVGGAGKALLKAYGIEGVASRLPLANVTISNVPGPEVPLYLAGARMISFHPLSIVLHGVALNITVQTYAGAVDFGIVGAKNAVPRIQDLADAIEQAFEEGLALFTVAAQARPAEPADAEPARTGARRKPQSRAT